MPKPTDLPNWATDAAFPAGVEPEAGDPNKVEPNATKQGIGWRPNEKPAAEWFNWWMNLVYLWIVYVNAGNFDGPITITGNLNVTGDLDVDDDVNIDGDLVIDGVTYHNLLRSYGQGWEGGTTSGAALGFNHATSAVTLGAGLTAMVPCRAPYVGGVSKIKSISVLFDNNSNPNLILYVKSGTTSTAYGPVVGVTNVSQAVGAFQTRRTMTIDTPANGADIGANDRVFLSIENTNGAASLICYELVTNYHAPPP